MRSSKPRIGMVGASGPLVGNSSHVTVMWRVRNIKLYDFNNKWRQRYLRVPVWRVERSPWAGRARWRPGTVTAAAMGADAARKQWQKATAEKLDKGKLHSAAEVGPVAMEGMARGGAERGRGGGSGNERW